MRRRSIQLPETWQLFPVFRLVYNGFLPESELYKEKLI